MNYDLVQLELLANPNLLKRHTLVISFANTVLGKWIVPEEPLVIRYTCFSPPTLSDHTVEADGSHLALDPSSPAIGFIS